MDDLERAYHIAAEVVAKLGDTYLPIFGRLHQEILSREEKEKMKSLALAVLAKQEGKPT